MSRFWGLFLSIFGITVGAMVVSVGVAELFAALIHFPTNWQHYVVALGVPAVTTPVWAIPLVRANRRLHRATKELRFLAETDPLCGILNRRAFFTQSAAICRAADRNGEPVAVMMIDLDRFKSVNDELGHNAGDTVIRAVAATIGAVIADHCPGAVFARLGGDEFALVIGGIRHVEAGMIAEDMCARVRRVSRFEGSELTPTTVSVGVAMRRRRQSVGEVLKTADEAVYKAKEKGRDQAYVIAFAAIPAAAWHPNPKISDRIPTSRVA